MVEEDVGDALRAVIDAQSELAPCAILKTAFASSKAV